METLDSVIATLNNLGMGALDKIEADLRTVRLELERRELGELVEKLDLCHRALTRGELQEFRRLRETLVSRLGHIRLKTD
ncbi:MAG TPA: hypothetical protein VJ921_07780 [Vicinamibacteria bacterium]|nr:hypothetical protein [Vicinamibacteria bacterium]